MVAKIGERKERKKMEGRREERNQVSIQIRKEERMEGRKLAKSGR